MRACTHEHGKGILAGPYGEPIASIAHMAFDHTLPILAFEPVDTMPDAQYLLGFLRVLENQPYDVLQLRQIDMPAPQSLDVAAKGRGVIRFQPRHIQIPNASNISSASWKRSSPSLPMRRASANAYSVSSGALP